MDWLAISCSDCFTTGSLTGSGLVLWTVTATFGQPVVKLIARPLSQQDTSHQCWSANLSLCHGLNVQAVGGIFWSSYRVFFSKYSSFPPLFCWSIDQSKHMLKLSNFNSVKLKTRDVPHSSKLSCAKVCNMLYIFLVILMYVWLWLTIVWLFLSKESVCSCLKAQWISSKTDALYLWTCHNHY